MVHLASGSRILVFENDIPRAGIAEALLERLVMQEQHSNLIFRSETSYPG